MSETFKAYWWIFLGGAIAGRFFFRRWKKTAKGREVVDAREAAGARVRVAVPQDGALAVRVARSRC